MESLYHRVKARLGLTEDQLRRCVHWISGQHEVTVSVIPDDWNGDTEQEYKGRISRETIKVKGLTKHCSDLMLFTSVMQWLENNAHYIAGYVDDPECEQCKSHGGFVDPRTGKVRQHKRNSPFARAEHFFAAHRM